MLKDRNVRTGEKVYYFELKCPVPRSSTIEGKYVKPKYTGQQAHIDEDRADRARDRSEQKRQVAEQEALRRDEEAMEVASAQAQAAAAEEEKQLANMTRQHPACHFGPEEDRSSMTLPPDLIAQSMSRGSIQVVNKTTDLDDQGKVKPDKIFHKTGGKRTKNRTPSDNVEEVGNKIVLVSRPYDIDLQVISDLSAGGAMDYLPDMHLSKGRMQISLGRSS